MDKAPTGTDLHHEIAALKHRLEAIESPNSPHATRLRIALGNDDAFHDRIAALEKNCHEPQEIEPRVIRALIDIGVIGKFGDRWQISSGARILAITPEMEAAAAENRSPLPGAQDRQESLSDDGEFPSPFTDAHQGYHATPQEAADALARYDSTTLKRLRDHLSNVRPLPVMPIPDWLAAVIAAEGIDPAKVQSIHIATGHSAHQGPDTIPPRPEFRQPKVMTGWGKILFKFQVGDRVQWWKYRPDNPAGLRPSTFGFWTIVGQHVAGNGARTYQLQGLARMVPEADLDSAQPWQHAFDTRPRPHHWGKPK